MTVVISHSPRWCLFFYWTNSLILILLTINDKDLRCWDAAMFCIFARKSIIEVVAINQLIFLVLVLVGVTLSYNLVCLVAANSSKRQWNLWNGTFLSPIFLKSVLKAYILMWGRSAKLPFPRSRVNLGLEVFLWTVCLLPAVWESVALLFVSREELGKMPNQRWWYSLE